MRMFAQVSSADAAALVTQLSAIDVTLVNELFTATMASVAAEGSSSAASALTPARDVTRSVDALPEAAAAWTDAGLAAVARGAVGVIILAGGQGTRLGFDKPKGQYDLALPSHKSLFQLQAERITRVRALAAAATGKPLASVSLPLYVMTSPMTDADTRSFFAAHSNFGLPEGEVQFFCQGTLPCLDFDGRIMLESGARVAEAPDGNGGIYRGLHLSGAVANMRSRGVVGVHVFAVDNAIVRAADPAFIGYCLSRGADVGSKVVAKAGPHEKVGVLCLRDGAYSVVEYSEMDKATAELRDERSGALAFNAGNVCIHYYSTHFLETRCSPSALPKVYHVARKAIPYAHPETGETMTKAEISAVASATGGVTGVKLESFIFDVFPMATSMAVLEVPRESEFAPVKNAPGAADDSPDTARALLRAAHARWLAAAGALLPPDGGAVEVSPLVSYAGEGLGALAGVTLTSPSLIVAAGEPPLAGEEGSAAAAVAPGVTHGMAGAVHVYRVSN